VRDEHGFTLVELMVVVLIISILVVLALPTFLGTRERASDRATQANIRNAFAAERAYYTDTLTYTTDPAQMTAIEAAITYVDGDTPLVEGVVYLHLHAVPNEIFASAMSPSGTCWYLREIDGGGAQFASDDACGVTDTQAYTRAW
jgi:type IV pilus assembly protein PilA